MNRLRIGLVGVGRHGGRYIRHMVKDLPEVKLTAVCRRDATRPIEPAFAEEIPCYSDYRELIAAPVVEAVIGVVPPALNRDVCLAAIRAKKPILIEKPLATTAADAAAIVQAADRAGISVMTAHTLRFDPAIVSLKHNIGEVGTAQYAGLTLRMEPGPVQQNPSSFGGRGILLETGIHLIDLARYLTGEEIAEVRCWMNHVPPTAPETFVLAWLRTVGGMLVWLDVSRVSSGRIGRAEWIGEKGQLEADWQTHRLTLTSSGTENRQWTVEASPTIVDTVRSFVRSVREGVRPPIDGNDGKRAVEIAEACYESAQRHGDVMTVQYR